MKSLFPTSESLEYNSQDDVWVVQFKDSSEASDKFRSITNRTLKFRQQIFYVSRICFVLAGSFDFLYEVLPLRFKSLVLFVNDIQSLSAGEIQDETSRSRHGWGTNRESFLCEV